MSKFLQISRAYQDIKHKKTQYDELYQNFAIWLFNQLVAYYEMPKGTIKLWAPGRTRFDPQATYSIDEALEFSDQDEHWHFAVLAAFDGTANWHTADPILIEFVFRQKDDHFMVHVSEDGKVFPVYQTDLQTVHDFFDHLFNFLVKRYGEALKPYSSR